MSLNGLEDAKVIEAHRVAAIEAGGWFLLKYSNRDEVELLSRGNGGIVDIRGAIAKYEETSPLFGFLRYRRRNVILKYEPDDCSRLVKARAAVHFNAVCERFAPCDTTFEISTAKDLKDSKLSAACSLHAASGSASSSSSSLRRRRLNEIAEEEEEEERERKRQSTVKEEDRRASSIYSAHARPTSPERPAILDRKQISDPQETNFASTTNVPEFTGADRPTSPTKSETAPRLSSQSTRPDPYSYSTHAYGKPKVKLGPRPSLDVSNRPSTAGNFRPIAALPAGFKFFSKGGKKGHSQDSEHADKVEDMAPIPPKPSVPIPEVPQDNDNQLPQRPATSSGASMKSTNHSLAPTKEVKMTPEKARLMKAMKLREKKKMMNSMTAEQTEVMDKNVDKEEDDTDAKDSLRIKDAGHRTVSHADSGIAIDPPTPMTINTEDTSDSHPNSPTAATLSEIGASTKASSLSESTDETVQVTKDTGEDVESTTFQEVHINISDSGHATGTTQDKESRAVTQETDVSDMGIVETEESSQIPVSNNPLQTREPAIRESIEVDEPIKISLSTQGNDTRQSPKEEDAPKSPWGLPVSKFSSNESRTPTSPTTNSLKSKFSIPEISLPIDCDSVPDLPNRSEARSTSTNSRERTGLDSSPNTNAEVDLPVEKNARRKASVGPIRTDLSKTTPRSEVSDPLLDDDLMDELQSATVQEAKPISVSKSPITPVFPNNNLLGQAPKLARTVSNPMRGPLLAPSDVSQVSARSVSAGGAAFLHSITRQASNAGLQSKKNNIGSSISQRIKALEKLSSGGPVEDARPRTATPSSQFFHARRQSIKEPVRSQSVADRTDSLARHAPTPERSREVTPETPGQERRERSLSVASRLSVFEPTTSPRGRPESIQVTARIIRDPSQNLLKKAETNTSLGEYPQLDLKQSPLVVDLQRAESQPFPRPQPTPLATPPKETIKERRDKSSDDAEKKKRRRSSLSIVKEFMKDRRASIVSKSTDNLSILSPNDAKSPNRPPSAHHNSGGFARRLSISSRRSSISRERDNAASTPLGSPAVLSDSGSETEKSDKKKNRASRFMRRLSNSLNGSRKNTSPHISPTVTEEDADQVAAATATTTAAAAASTTDVSTSSQPAVVAYMGDVNVQFPDNLLWKRRSMCLDTQGFLFLSAVQGVATAGRDKAGLKRYHMSDFRAPCIPDVEIQELPNSVVLDLLEGSCLQIACEDRAGQLNVLHALQDAHQSHSSFGQ
ncbi:uncharacterized protein GGS22DRAFT_104556 [Annulohypoxylon maeteangense]|uniref:uncharacterized protein n=1 Tax=Annulohypoxylon maeteangense TaxID=1927788 RepID=UPI002008A232|nr:uncharacterized protein GGS22DRAFT_104556 [Annulohypoxylon maeteangense]KAI0887113.1 hypothetical protein GGS22DRAFT_104556 [Annulohypoxylon maeteangense]